MRRRLSNRLVRAVSRAVLTVAILPGVAAGQQGAIQGRVRTSGFGEGIAGVSVTLRGTARTTLTNEEGLFAFSRLVDGVYWLEFSMLGYTARSDSVRLEDGRSAWIEVALSASPVQLDALRVVARSGPTAAWLASQGFPQRGSDSLAMLHLTEREIARQGVRNLNDVLRRVKNLRMRTLADGSTEFLIEPSPLPDGGRCPVAIYLNGHLVEFGTFNWTGVRANQRASRPMRVDDLLRLQEVDGIELYGPDTSPVAGACGTLLLWSGELRPSVDAQLAGTIRGSAVLGSSGRSVAGVRVTLKPSGVQVVTDESGRFEIADVLPGEYEISAEYAGLETWRALVRVLAFGVVELKLDLEER